MEKKDKRGLGRGLSALMSDTDLADQISGAVKPNSADSVVPIEKLHPNPAQPRRSFASDDMNDLTASIREKGVIQPLIVRQSPDSKDEYQIVAGERRWRAAQQAGLHELPIIVRELNDTEVLEVAIIENIQRSDLNAVEEAQSFQQLMDRFGHTQEKLAAALGKSRSHIANLLRLLTLPDDVLTLLKDGKLTAGHARTLVTSNNPSELARKIVTGGLSVRQAEKLAVKPEKTQNKAKKIKAVKDADTVALEHDLGAGLGMKVSVDHQSGTESGSVTVTYKSFDELDQICQILSASVQDGSR